MSATTPTPFTAGTATHYIDGHWVEEGAAAVSYNPATDEALGEFFDGSIAAAEAAIAAAHQAFVGTDWRRNRHARAAALWDLATAFERNAERLASAITIENGKPLGEAGFEVSLIGSKLRYYASLALSDLGTSMATAGGDVSLVLHEPIGVAGIIVPWNSPAILSVRSFAPALAAGCTAAIKMPAQTGLTNRLIAEIVASVDSVPAGVLNFFTESGNDGAQLLVSSPLVRVISYTGSTAVGARIAAAAGTHLKRISLELGGKTPMIVFPDANLDVAIPTLTAGVTTFAGQFCMTGSRILVHRDIADQVAERLAGSLGGVRHGNGLDPETQMGPMISHESVARLSGLLAAEASELIVPGGPVDGPGAFFRPALLGVADTASSLIQDELFGPVATFETFADEDEAIARANATQYGLAASVWTADGGRSLRMAHGLDVGTVWTNSWAMVLDQFEEGGTKGSGVGRLNGPGGLREFQEPKQIFRSVL